MPDFARRLLVALPLLAALGCGPAATLHDLRCGTPCQDLADPFLLHLAVDVDDPNGELRGGGQLVVRIEGVEQTVLALDELWEDPQATSATLAFPLALRLRRLTDGERFVVGVIARRGAVETNEVSLPFRIDL